MGLQGFFTRSDLETIDRAVSLAEKLTVAYFDLPEDEWRINPYSVFTIRDVDKKLHHSEVFAHVFRYPRKPRTRSRGGDEHAYGIALQDPNILRALLRTAEHDLWTLSLYTLTHELTHIVRFRRFGADFFAPLHERDKEERIVHSEAKEMLMGVANTDALLTFYNQGPDCYGPSSS